MGSSPCYVASFSRFKQVINLIIFFMFSKNTKLSCRRRFKIHPSTVINEKFPSNSKEEELTVKSISKTIAQYLSFILFFPLMPIYLFIRILWKNDGEDSKEDLSRNFSLKLANEVSIIYITIESSLQSILTIWLILRGIIRSKLLLISLIYLLWDTWKGP